MEMTMKVDLCGVETGGAAWTEARDAVTASMLAHGFVVVKHDSGREIREALFGRAMPELFALPLEAKQRNVHHDVPFGGYLGGKRGSMADDSESLRIPDVTHAQPICDFANLLWSEGNPAFCNTVGEFCKNAIKLEHTVTRMVFEGLGVGTNPVIDSQEQGRAVYGIRMCYYGACPDMEKEGSLPAHRDITLTTVIVQHEVEGLEVQLKDGSWLSVPPEPDTCTIVAGELLTVITNGRVQACVHRVRTPSNRQRRSVLVARMPIEGDVVRPLDELVDHLHPALYQPCDTHQYFSFKFSEEGSKSKDPLETFCGVAAAANDG